MNIKSILFLFLMICSTTVYSTDKTEIDNIRFTGTIAATNSPCYISWTCPWDTNSYFKWTSPTQMVLRFEGSNTYFNKEVSNGGGTQTTWMVFPMNVGIKWVTDSTNYLSLYATSPTQTIMQFTVDGVQSNTMFNMVGD